MWWRELLGRNEIWRTLITYLELIRNAWNEKDADWFASWQLHWNIWLISLVNFSSAIFFPTLYYCIIQWLMTGTSMVFCYQNCSDLHVRKNGLVVEKNFWIWKSRLNMQNVWDRSLEQFIQTVKGQNNFW